VEDIDEVSVSFWFLSTGAYLFFKELARDFSLKGRIACRVECSRYEIIKNWHEILLNKNWRYETIKILRNYANQK
jgi:hypothetical protein